MRLDKFLKVSRLVKRRTVANEICDAGKVTVNEKVARASLAVKEGDVLTINVASGKLMKLQIVNVNEYCKKEQAADMYKIINQ